MVLSRVFAKLGKHAVGPEDANASKAHLGLKVAWTTADSLAECLVFRSEYPCRWLRSLNERADGLS